MSVSKKFLTKLVYVCPFWTVLILSHTSPSIVSVQKDQKAATASNPKDSMAVVKQMGQQVAAFEFIVGLFCCIFLQTWHIHACKFVLQPDARFCRLANISIAQTGSSVTATLHSLAVGWCRSRLPSARNANTGCGVTTGQSWIFSVVGR